MKTYRLIIRKARERTAAAAAIALLLLSFTISGCASMASKALVQPITLSLQKQTDLHLVLDGVPSILLILDGFVASDPGNRELLVAATRLYASYGAALSALEKKDRARSMSVRAKEYGLELLNLNPVFAENAKKPLVEFSKALPSFTSGDVASLFWGGYGWASWIEQQGGTPAAMADLPKVEQLMLRVVALDENFYFGSAHLFLGAYYGSRPAMLGGDFKKSKHHFDRALSISKGRFLPAQVLYADVYARMTLDRKLFQTLLTTVIDWPQDDEQLALTNLIARKRARQLLDEIDTYF